MKPGDIVYGKYKGQYGECKVLSVYQKTTGALWWKKTIDVALVRFTIQWTYMGHKNGTEDIIVERPVSELREIL
jgi:hypothetical protein